MIREILIWPEAILARKCELVTRFDADLKRLLDDMVQTMVAARGAGLAASQVGFALRAIVVLVDAAEGRIPLKLINPVIVETRGSRWAREGCLSLPGFFEVVKRAAYVRVEALDEDGQKIELGGDGKLAQALQHEIEHLDGIVFADHLSPLKRTAQRRRFEKQKAKGLKYQSVPPKPQDFTQQTPAAVEAPAPE